MMAKHAHLFTSLQELGFEAAGSVCFGRWKGYAVSVRPDTNVFLVDFAVRPPLGDRPKELLNSLTAAMKSRTGKRVAVSNAQGQERNIAFSFVLKLKGKTPYSEQFTAFADACADSLRACGLPPAGTCAVCGGGTPESLCFIGSYQPVHSACMRSTLEKTREKAEENQTNGSYLTGFVGALLGMLLGLIPNILIAVLNDTIYALLFALVPLAAMWCYRKFNGKMNKASIVIIIVVSLLGVFVMQYVSLAIYLMQEYGAALGEALAFTAELFADGESLGAILSDSVMHFVFMALGILFAWRYLNQTNSSSVAGVEAQLSTLRPNPDFAPESEHDF